MVLYITSHQILSYSRLETSSAHLSPRFLDFLITVFLVSNSLDLHIDLFLGGCFLSLINSSPREKQFSFQVKLFVHAELKVISSIEFSYLFAVVMYQLIVADLSNHVCSCYEQGHAVFLKLLVL